MAEFTEDKEQQHEKMFRDLYFGNGEAAITVRMERSENRVKAVENAVETIRSDAQKTRDFVKNVLVTVIGSTILVVLTLAADMLVKYMK